MCFFGLRVCSLFFFCIFLGLRVCSLFFFWGVFLVIIFLFWFKGFGLFLFFLSVWFVVVFVRFSLFFDF